MRWPSGVRETELKPSYRVRFSIDATLQPASQT